MGKFIDLAYALKKYGKLTPLEIRSFIISIVIIAFVISFRDWGSGEKVNLAVGFLNLLISIVIVAVSFFVHHLAHRIAALSVGYKPEYKMNTYGLLLAVVLAIVTRGYLWFLIPGGIMLHHLAGLRLGFFRYGLNYFGLGLVSALGSVATVIFALILKLINEFLVSEIIYKAFIFNLLFAVYMILPIPPADGNKMFFGSRMVYTFIFTAVISSAVLLYIDIPVWLALIGTLLIALVAWVLYYVLLEVNLWKGPYQRQK